MIVKLAASDASIWIVIFLIAFFGGIALLTFILYRVLRLNKKDRLHKKSEDEIAREELNRVLEPIKDKEIQKQMNEYQKENQSKSE
ncbi:MAG: hypothetical protein LBR37_02055 [Erysipelotrichaceae bacterium]|jgi:sortase (surface protein transpeptidase)|nr:hypothetical protein [Erysipelotrichaceae bacterium]